MADINKFVSERFSPKRFSSRVVENDKIELIFEAARWAPSCFNEQPWRFIYCTKDDNDDYQKMLSCMSESNQVWARTAYILAISFASSKFSQNGKLNRFAAYDTGMAMSNILCQATDSGLFVHQLGGFNAERAKTILEIPEDFEVLAMMAIGYLDDNFLTESMEYKESRKRNDKEIFAFKGKFNKH